MVSPIKWILSRVAARHARNVRQAFHEVTKRPTETQRTRLFEQLGRERETAFGRDHHFSSIGSLADFRRELPIATYEYFEPYIERVKQGDLEAMFHRQKVLMFALTSGTTSSRKFVPVTRRYLDDYRRGWTVWGLHMYETHKHLWFKTLIQIVSDWQEFTTSAGIPCGSISGLTAKMQRHIVRKTYCLPPVSGKVKDIRAKYYLVWRLGLIRNVGLLISANPSTMVNLARFGDEHHETLIRNVHDGTTDDRFAIPDEVRRAIAKRLRPNRERARELENVVTRTGRMLPKDVWPDLGLIGAWTGGSVGAYMRHYPEYFGAPSIRDIGLIASEGRMTIPIENDTSGGILDITSGFFEFIPVEESDSPNPTVLEAHELLEGRDYFILLTTSSGLYRYNIFDVVRCVGYHEKTPVLAFLNKGNSFSNLTGEKLSEHQVASAVEASLARLDLRVTAYTLAPRWDDRMPHYGLFVEAGDFATAAQAKALAAEVEEQLRRQNSEYADKRDSRRLGPIEAVLLDAGTWRRWDAERLARAGGAAEQYKHPCLIADLEFERRLPLAGGSDAESPNARLSDS